MKIDLDRALAQIAGTAEVAARPVPIDRLLGRVHRRRTARTVTHGVVGVGATAAVAFGGMQLAETGPQNAPGTAPVGSDAPTTPPAAEKVPPCGEPLPVVARAESEQPTLRVWLGLPTIPLGNPGDVMVFRPNDSAPDLDASATAGEIETLLVTTVLTDLVTPDAEVHVEVFVLRDGVRVTPSAIPEVVLQSNPPGYLAGVALASCATEGFGEPLPAGDYEVRAVEKRTLPGQEPVVAVGAASFTIAPSGEVLIDEAYLQHP